MSVHEAIYSAWNNFHPNAVFDNPSLLVLGYKRLQEFHDLIIEKKDENPGANILFKELLAGKLTHYQGMEIFTDFNNPDRVEAFGK